MSDNPILVWSPDSKKIATFQQDQRKVGEMYLVPTDGHPALKAWKYPLVGDEDVTMIERVIIDVEAREGGSAEDAAGPASVHSVRRRELRGGTAGTMCSGAKMARTWRSSRPRATTSRSGCAWPTPRPATCAR
jgi:hypothetical protein